MHETFRLYYQIMILLECTSTCLMINSLAIIMLAFLHLLDEQRYKIPGILSVLGFCDSPGTK